MKSKLTLTAKIFNPSVHTTQAGAKLYSFSMGISQQDKKTEQWLNMYLPVTIFDKEDRHSWILKSDKKEITIEGQLTIKSGYTKRDGTAVAPQIGVFGFEAYTGKKPQPTTEGSSGDQARDQAQYPTPQQHQNSPQATNAPQQVQEDGQSVPTATQPVREENYRDPVSAITIADEEIPF